MLVELDLRVRHAGDLALRRAAAAQDEGRVVLVDVEHARDLVALGVALLVGLLGRRRRRRGRDDALLASLSSSDAIGGEQGCLVDCIMSKLQLSYPSCHRARCAEPLG